MLAPFTLDKWIPGCSGTVAGLAGWPAFLPTYPVIRAGFPTSMAQGGTSRSNNGSRAHQCMGANGDAGQNGCVGSDGCAGFYGRNDRMFVADAAPRELVVGEGGIRTDENVVFQPYPVPDLHSAFYGDAIADNHVIFNKSVIANVTIHANCRARKHVSEGPDAGSFPHGLGFHNPRGRA